MADPYHGPKLPWLRRLYDEGVAAAEADTDCPYDPPQNPGDATRAHFWRQGLEDERVASAIRSLV